MIAPEDLAGDRRPPNGSVGRNWNTRDAGFGRTVWCPVPDTYLLMRTQLHQQEEYIGRKELLATFSSEMPSRTQ